MRRRTFTLAAMAAPFARTSWATAAALPTGPVRIVVGFAPGGGTDVLARLIGQQLAEMWKTSVLVENKPGATGVIAADYVAKQPADGTTLLMAHVNSHAIAPALMSNVRYDPRKDFAPIALVGVTPNMLTCSDKQKVRTLPEIIALCRSKPGQISFGSSGIGSAQHLAFEMFKLAAKVDAVHVPYKGSGAVTDLMSGRVQFMFATLPSVLGQIHGGKLKALGQVSQRRFKGLREVPTMKELGVPGMENGSWYAFYVVRGTPQPIIDKINTTVNAILKEKEVLDYLEQNGADAVGGSPQDCARIIKADLDTWGPVVKRANVQAD